jgi:hypothetical protein
MLWRSSRTVRKTQWMRECWRKKIRLTLKDFRWRLNKSDCGKRSVSTEWSFKTKFFKIFVWINLGQIRCSFVYNCKNISVVIWPWKVINYSLAYIRKIDRFKETEKLFAKNDYSTSKKFHWIASSDLYYKPIMMVVSDNFNYHLYYKFGLAWVLSLS